MERWNFYSVGGIHRNVFEEIIAPENLLAAWREFRRGKRKKRDVQLFEFNLEDNLFQLRESLLQGTYTHDPYTSFYVRDPKLRHIHKASVRDRVLHQAIFRVLYPIFNARFIFDSYASRKGKGTHAAVMRLERFLIKASKNHTRPAFALKCDIRKFFDSVDHEILLNLINRRVGDAKTLRLIKKIVQSYQCPPSSAMTCHSACGLPLGNVTSQLFANIYLHELDWFVKHTLRVPWYVRYCDDFMLVAEDDGFLAGLISQIGEFLSAILRLELHPQKIILRPYTQGVDFLGYILRPHHRMLRTRTKRRMFRRIDEKNRVSYLGVLKHCNGYTLERKLHDHLLLRFV